MSVLYDTVIVGGGPAGLNAALVLARCRRTVLLCDAGRPRNAASGGLHGFLTRDGVLPLELIQLGREELRRYGVEIHREAAVSAARCGSCFETVLESGGRCRSRTLLLATGVVDRVPPIPGIEEFYGRSVFHCPYCDGWEMRDQPLAALGPGKPAAGLALSLLSWSRDVVLLTHGPARLSQEERERLKRRGVPLREERIARLEGADGVLGRVAFKNGETLARRGIFFNTGQVQRSQLAAALGCRFTHRGAVRADRMQATGVTGLYVAGDACRDVQFAIVAAAEGARAAVAIHRALQHQERA